MIKKFLTACLFLFSVTVAAQQSNSFYTERPDDPLAVYFTADQFAIKADGKTDVSVALQQAINDIKQKKNFGILFIPEGTYRISKTIYIPQAVRLIGYGKKRPLIVLAQNAPGFQQPNEQDKGKAKYIFWFTSGIVKDEAHVPDAGAGTFYSAMSNIDVKIEDGKPQAVALRTHYAQHSFVEHMDIHINKGKAGLFEIGNLLQDIRFYGGDYGIYTTKASPGWQFMMLDTYFEGQRKAAIKTQEAGLTIVRMQVKNVPEAISIDSGYWEKLILQDAHFENVAHAVLVINNETNPNTQLNGRNINCRNVPIFARYLNNKKKPVTGKGKNYYLKSFSEGLQMQRIDDNPQYRAVYEMQELHTFPEPVASDIPSLPGMKQWVNLKTLGAKGDGQTDDTRAIQNAIDQYDVIYVPQGWYKISETLKMRSGTVLIGLSPIATQFILQENAAAFGGFGGPKAMIASSKGGTNILTGIGLSTGQSNPRAVACKWMAGAASYVNDVKFIGGHGNMDNALFKSEGSPYREGGDRLWDTQFWSLWITDGGGGIFKNIWSAHTWALNGVYISNTSTKGKIYALSVEHHVRNEVRFNRVANWEVYALQTEEESREGTECQPLEIQDCSDMLFANLYMFHVIRVNKPYPYSIRSWNSKSIEFRNVHNYAQTKFPSENTLYDIGTHTEVRPWELALLRITGSETKKIKSDLTAERLATGFEFAAGMCSDSKGNIYFCESRMKRIYKWDAASATLHLLADYPWQPLSLSCDKNDQLLVVFRYDPKPGYLLNGKPEVFNNPPDADGTSFSGWGNSGFGVMVYAIDPTNPDETIRLLQKVPMGSVQPVYKVLYPAHRWRDFHDFNTIVTDSARECWLAPDKVTIIPAVYDLARATSLSEGFPGKPMYATDEYNERTVQLFVSKYGYVSNLKPFVEKGTFALCTDNSGNLYLIDGQIYSYDRAAKLLRQINVPERPTGIIWGGKDHRTLFITGYHSLYQIKIQ